MRPRLRGRLGAALVGVALALTPAAPVAAEPPAAHRAAVPFVFTSDRDGDTELYYRTRVGLTVRLTDNDADDFDAAYSPDGRQIAFVSTRDGDEEIFVMTASGGQARQLTANTVDPDGSPILDARPAWSPDGTRLAFISTRSGGAPKIWVMAADGADPIPLTAGEPFVFDSDPTWSPDGRFLAFASNRAGDANFEIFRMRPDGTAVTRLTRTEDGVSDTAPDWSPDGTRIAFVSSRGADFFQHVFVMAADGRDPTQLTATPQVDEVFPRWTADGSRLLFATFPDPATGRAEDVYVVAADGTGRRLLTPNPAADSFPDPRPAG